MKNTSQQAIAARIGSARFSTYLSESAGDQSRALQMYLWNLEVAAAVTSTTSMVEVHLRNTVDLAIKSWNASQNHMLEPGRPTPYSPEWITDPAPRIRNIVVPSRGQSFQDKARSSMKDINNRLTKLYPTHDDYVAGLTFGTWTSLLPHPTAGSQNVKVEIWDAELSKHFSKHRNAVYYWAQHLRYARNRAAHLEPMLDVGELWHFHRCAVRLLNALDPAAASWLAGQAYIPRVVVRKP